MFLIDKEVEQFASWPTPERIRALKRIIPRANVEAVLGGGKKPEAIHREIWMHWLAYNLTRKVMAQAALAHEKLPRQLSFASALAAVTGAWDLASVADPATLSLHAKTQHLGIARSRVGHRPNRVEPRAVKRRPKPRKLLTQPRQEARAKLMGTHGMRC